VAPVSLCLLEVWCGDKAMNAAVAIDVGPANHALVTQSEGVGCLRVGESHGDETRLGLHSVVGPFVRFNVLGEIPLAASDRKPDYVAIAVDARTHGVPRIEQIEVLVLRTLEPRAVEIVIEVLPA